MIGHLLQKHQAGERVKATVLRGKERVELTLPMPRKPIMIWKAARLWENWY